MRTLLIDNYDSFTYNLFHLLSLVNGREPYVLRNDDAAAFEELDPDAFDAVVISPGPGHPERERDFGVSARVLGWGNKPLLGVCLGHQGLCHFAGASIEPTEPYHGRTTPVHHDGSGLFVGIPSPFRAVRYHSLVAKRIPETLEVCAWTADGLVMGVRHRERPHWGVQFHPESIAAEHGRTLLENFRCLCLGTGAPVPHLPPPSRRRRHLEEERSFTLHLEEHVRVPSPAAAFRRLDAGGTVAWLDSSARDSSLARFSIIAFPSDALGELVSYRVGTDEVQVKRLRDGAVSRISGSVFTYLERELERRSIPEPGLPCGFALGYVGTLGYELKAECGGVAAHRSPTPDAVLAFCDRALVFDHELGEGTLLALAAPDDPSEALEWLAHTRRELEALSNDVADGPGRTNPEDEFTCESALTVWQHDATAYYALIDACHDAIRQGESYELCLTNRIRVAFDGDPVQTYLALRRESPVPFGAFLRFPEFSVLSASPERFLWLDSEGNVESRPIKGTGARALDDPSRDRRSLEALQSSEKERSENLMIVDLVRNDLGRVCDVGSVHVPRLFGVESFRTVHQLVSTIAGRLRQGESAVSLVRACFPGGSMTGAPKLRTMEILDRLEGVPRGIYSGALGYFSLSGAMDLSIVIRTMVLSGGYAEIGVGGAIVALSEPRKEWDETQLKAAALLRTLELVRRH